MAHTKEHAEPVAAADVQVVLDARTEAKEAEVAPGLIEVPRDNGTSSFSDSVTQKVTENKPGDETVVISAKSAPLTTEVIDGVFVDEIETPVVVRETRVIDTRLNRVTADAYLAKLKASNPKKFAAKTIELDAKIAENERVVKANADAKVASDKAAKKSKKDEDLG